MKAKVTLLLVAFLLIPLVVNAEGAKATTIEGRMNGIQCAINGIWCPIDKADPLVAIEPDFVIQLPSGKFFLLPNLDRAVKARVVLEKSAVTGAVDEKYKSILVDKLEVTRHGKRRLVWSKALEDELRKELFAEGN